METFSLWCFKKKDKNLHFLSIIIPPPSLTHDPLCIILKSFRNKKFFSSYQRKLMPRSGFNFFFQTTQHWSVGWKWNGDSSFRPVKSSCSETFNNYPSKQQRQQNDSIHNKQQWKARHDANDQFRWERIIKAGNFFLLLTFRLVSISFDLISSSEPSYTSQDSDSLIHRSWFFFLHQHFIFFSCLSV